MSIKWWRIAAKVLRAVGLHRTIYDRDGRAPYLERYYLFSTRWLAPIFPNLSYRMVIHNTKQSDDDGLHDHPWSWKSKILEGGYWEDTPEGRFWRTTGGGWRSRSATDYHRLVLDDEYSKTHETWSLFIMGPKEKEWGFLDDNGQWVKWDIHLAHRNKVTA